MDPEPGRCRRTDGYKWRCRRDVLPNTKYCERHIHRGRSRKHVETSKITLQLNSNTPTITYPSSNTPKITYSRKTSQKINSSNPDDASATFSPPVHGNQQNKIQSLSESKGLTCTATAITTSDNGKSKTNSVRVENDKSSREKSDDLNGVVAGSDRSKDRSNKESSNSGGSPTPERTLSAKSVVNSDTISCNKVCEHRDVIAEEPQRCRRTDGKRWQCSNEAIPQQKYCESHMHRGSKRCRSSSEAETFNATPAAHFEPKSGRTNLNTDLLISPVKCPQPTSINLDSSTSGSSRDSTTITDTDENISTSHILS